MFGYGYRQYIGDPLVDRFFELIERKSGEEFSEVRALCEAANRQDGRYNKALRKRIAHIRWVIEGMDGYEQITNCRLTAFGCEIDSS